MFKDVYELSRNELYELKEKLFYGCYEISNLEIEDQILIDSIELAEEIPLRLVYSAFSGYDFVDDDFFCNM